MNSKTKKYQKDKLYEFNKLFNTFNLNKNS